MLSGIFLKYKIIFLFITFEVFSCGDHYEVYCIVDVDADILCYIHFIYVLYG